jgi:hypothetical protein
MGLKTACKCAMAGGFADRVERRHTAGGSRAAGRHTGSIWLADGRIKAVLANATHCDFALTVRDADRPTASLRLRVGEQAETNS